MPNTNPVLERIPPQSMEAEQAVLGAMLLERDAIVKAVEMLHAEDFYRQSHRDIWNGMVALYHQREPVDLITLGEWLKVHGLLDAVGGALYLTTLMTQVPTAAGVGHYAGIVRDRADLRRLITTADTIMDQAYRADSDVDALLRDAETQIAKIGARQGGAVDFAQHQLAVLASQEFLRMEDEVAAGKPQQTGLYTDIPELNGMLAPGMHAGDLVIVCGRPSMGKTVAAVQNVGIPNAKRGLPVLMLSMEMRDYQLALRCLAANSIGTASWMMSDFDYRRDNWTQIADRERNPYEDKPIRDDLQETVARMWGWNFPILYEPVLTPNRVRQVGRQMKREHGLAMVIVDGLWLMNANTRIEKEYDRLTEIVREMKQLAGELETVVVLVHQLSRNTESRTDKRPIMSDLRASGEIEQSADLVVGLYRDGYYTRDASDFSAEFLVMKNRHGSTGMAHAIFDGPRFRFFEAAGEDGGRHG